jgi:hypothetical protein
MDMVLEFVYLEEMLNKMKIPRKSSTNNRRGFAIGHRAITLGITTGRFNGKTGLSYYSKKYPELFNEVKRIGDIIVPFHWKSCHLNNNVVCPPHRDTGNTALSCIISFGDYTGCDLVIEGETQVTRYTPCIFNGVEKLHWNEGTLIGNKYSLVFF